MLQTESTDALGMGRYPPLFCSLLSAATVVLTFAVLVYLTWGNWGSLRIDTGRELYVPQEIVRGRLLYRDLWYPYGPLAPYLNAAAFRIFGVHLNTLYFLGLTLTLGAALLLHAIARRFVGPLAAFVGAEAFLLQACRPGAFNYVLPYSSAATYGSLFGLIFLYLILRHTVTRSQPALMLAGFAAALALLCKIEFGAGCFLTMTFVLCAEWRGDRSRRFVQAVLKPLLPGSVLVAVVYAGFIWTAQPSSFFGDSSHTFSHTLKWVRGQGLRFDGLEIATLIATGALAMVFWCGLALATARIVSRPRTVVSCALIPLILLALFLPFSSHLSQGMGAGFLTLLVFPLGMYFLVLGLFVWAMRSVRTGIFGLHAFPLAVTSFYALAVGIRIFAQVAPFDYALYFNPVLFLAFLVLITRLVKYLLRAYAPRSIALALIFVMSYEALALAVTLSPWLRTHKSLLQTPRGTIYGSESVVASYTKVLGFLNEQSRLGRKVLILPEEVMLYFLSASSAPTRWYVLTPGILKSQADEERYIAAIDSAHVEYILLSNRDTSEYGFDYFGIDYCKSVYAWIEENYRVEGEFGQFRRGTGAGFGMLIYRRRPERRHADKESCPPELENFESGRSSPSPERFLLGRVWTRAQRAGIPDVWMMDSMVRPLL
jgi:hypothetical protein